ncbi:MAG: sigma-70 family RNA polymerase sigma factor [Planctomycetota bacterium]
MATDLTLLIHAARAGDHRAFGQVVSRTDALVRVVVGRQAAPEVVEDLIQETFLRAWEGLRGLRTPAAFKGWLIRIALGEVRKWRERQARERAALSTLDTSESYEARHGSGWSDRSLAALDALDPDSRAIALLRFCDGYAPREIAAALDLSPDVVRQRLSRAKAKLREALEANKDVP